MFNDNVSKSFKFTYFFSSFLLSYLFLLIIIYVQYIESSGMLFPSNLIITTKKVSFIILILITIISGCSLWYVRKKIKEDTKYSRDRSEKGKIGYSYNNGSREFILGVLLPVVTTISVPDTPITGLVGVLLIQVTLGYFYWHSNELFVNVPLIMLGYSLVIGKKDSQDLLLFVNNESLKSLLGKRVVFVYLGKVSESNLGIIVKEVNGEPRA